MSYPINHECGGGVRIFRYRASMATPIWPVALRAMSFVARACGCEWGSAPRQRDGNLFGRNDIIADRLEHSGIGPHSQTTDWKIPGRRRGKAMNGERP